jgi:hypothetical protein
MDINDKGMQNQRLIIRYLGVSENRDAHKVAALNGKHDDMIMNCEMLEYPGIPRVSPYQD